MSVLLLTGVGYSLDPPSTGSATPMTWEEAAEPERCWRHLLRDCQPASWRQFGGRRPPV